MIKGKIKIIKARPNGKPKTSTIDYTHPENWSEVTFGQFVKLIEIIKNAASDYVAELKILELFTGMKAFNEKDHIPSWNKVPADEARKVKQGIQFLKSPFDWAGIKDVPDYLDYNGEQYEIPKDLSEINYGSMEGIRNIIDAKVSKWRTANKDIPEEEQKQLTTIDFMDEWPKIVALVMQPIIDHKATIQEPRVKKLSSQLRDISVQHLYPIASFFLSKAMIYSIAGEKDYIENTKATKSTRVSRSWRSLVPSMFMRR